MQYFDYFGIKFVSFPLSSKRRRILDAKYKELWIVQLIDDLMNNKTTNPYQGSIALEQLYFINEAYPDMCAGLVQKTHSSWEKFLRKHQPRIILFRTRRNKLRVCLFCSPPLL